MRKSNKLLMGGFLTVITFITAIHVTIYAKYRKGDYTPYVERDAANDRNKQPIAAVKYVQLSNMQGVNIRFSETPSMDKTPEGITFRQVGDTLFISGEQTDYHPQGRPTFHLHLPGTVLVQMRNSNVEVAGALTPTPIHPAFDLRSSSVLFTGTSSYQSLRVAASEQSRIDFIDSFRIDSLEVELTTSTLTHRNGDIETFRLKTDPTSRVDMQSKYLMMASINETDSL